jgi:hypothetical protein
VQYIASHGSSVVGDAARWLSTGESMPARFALGRTVITSNASRTLDERSVLVALGRHVSGDWGEVCAEDRESNEQSLRHGLRLLSVYRDSADVTFWIITEADRSVTTVLLPEDY